MLKIGLSSYSLHRAIGAGQLDILGAVKWVAENGGEHIELSPSGFSFTGASDPLTGQIKRCAADCGIDLSSYTIGANFTLNGEGRTMSAEERAAEVKRVKEQVDIGGALGVKFMRHDAGWRQPEDCGIEQFDKDLPFVADACREIADYAKQYGITTSVENHGFYFQGSERVRRLVAAVGRDNFRTTLDVGNFCCADEDPVIALMNNIGIASMVHFKDFYIRDFVPTPETWFKSLHGRYLRGAITGCGDLDLRTVTKLIKESKFSGFISIEYEGIEECLTGAKISLNNVKALFNN